MHYIPAAIEALGRFTAILERSPYGASVLTRLVALFVLGILFAVIGLAVYKFG